MNFHIPVSQDILNRVASIDHFRGSWAGEQLIPAGRRKAVLAEAAVVGTAAACRLAGVRVMPEDLEAIAAGQVPASPDGAVMHGYHRARGTVVPRRSGALDTHEIRRLHAVMMGADDPGDGTPWRQSPHDAEAFDSEGRAMGRVFQTLPARLVADTLEVLLEWLEADLRKSDHHPLLVIGTFMIAFLSASPFDSGNLRLSLLLLQRMLVAAGYGHVPFASLEAVVEPNREDLYEAFDSSQTRIWTGESDLTPWLTFFLAQLQGQCESVQDVLERERTSTRFSPLQQAIVATVRENGTAKAGMLIRETGANRNTLKDNLRRLVDLGVLEKMGERRGTQYRIARAANPPGQASARRAGS